jgi:hypothetical protein
MVMEFLRGIFTNSATALLLILGSAVFNCVRADDGHTWRIIENSHFRALSDDSVDDVKKLLLELERFRLIVLKLLTIKVQPDAPPVDLVIFNKVGDFRNYTPNDNVAGFATDSREGHRLIVMPARIAHADAMHDVRHEYVHTLMAYYSYHLPRWYNEGLAEFLASVEIHKDEIIVGEPPKDRRSVSLYSFDKLVADTIDPTQTSLADAYLQYWLLTDYMLTDPKRSAKLDKYVALYNTGMDSLNAFKMSFGMTPQQMYRRKLRVYIHHFKAYRMKFDFSGVDSNFSIQPARKEEVKGMRTVLAGVDWKK